MHVQSKGWWRVGVCEGGAGLRKGEVRRWGLGVNKQTGGLETGLD